MAESEEESSTPIKLVKTLNFGAYERLSILLRPRSSERDWRALAALMEFTTEEILAFEEEKDPVLTILTRWTQRDQELATTNVLIEYLKKMRRLDAVQDLQIYIDNAPTYEEYKKRQEDEKVVKSIENGPVTMEENYDVFISYAAADVSFARQILSTLESKYHIRACINFRDFLPGVHRLEQIVEVIETRCSKVIAILSENYIKCEDCDHQAKVAMTLSPGCKMRKLIPVMYSECEIPPIMRGIFYLNYADQDYRENFWEKLKVAITGKKR